MAPAAPLRLAVPLAAALAGCFVDNAPVLIPGDEASTGATSDAPGSTGGESSADGFALGDGAATSTGTTDATTTTAGAPATIADPTDEPPPTCEELAGGDECLACACRACADDLAACLAEPGCVAIMACAAAHGCLGEGCLAPCVDVIVEQGGLSSPATLAALALSQCAEKACWC